MAKKVDSTATPNYKDVFRKLLASFTSASMTDEGGVIYCPSKLGFKLDMLTEKEEEVFRKILKAATNISVISIPIGRKKSRYKDIFGKGQAIETVRGKEGKSVLYVPPRTFQRVWCREGKAPDYVTIIS